MRKTWLIPIVGTIGNFFSVLMIWLLPSAIVGLILGAIAQKVFHNDAIGNPVLWVVILLANLGYPIYLFYMGASGKGAGKVDKVFGARQCTPEESEKLLPLITEVIDRHNQFSNTNLQYGKDIKLTILDDEEPNAFAYGKNQVMFNTGITNHAHPEIFKAILAHEIAHLHHKDTLIGLANYYVQIPTQIVFNRFKSHKIVSHLKDGLKAAANGGKNNTTNKVWASVCAKLYFTPALIVGTAVNFICNSVQKTLSKQQEFAADAYATKLGYHEGLIAFFEVLQQYHVKPNKLMALFESHPEPQLRIENINNILEQSK